MPDCSAGANRPSSRTPQRREHRSFLSDTVPSLNVVLRCMHTTRRVANLHAPASVAKGSHSPQRDVWYFFLGEEAKEGGKKFMA